MGPRSRRGEEQAWPISDLDIGIVCRDDAAICAGPFGTLTLDSGATTGVGDFNSLMLGQFRLRASGPVFSAPSSVDLIGVLVQGRPPVRTRKVRRAAAGGHEMFHRMGDR